ncbi:MAG: translation factor Sua5 [Spirochaetales bacterium]|nr:translation factor Sua5 [Spirochaetales bacterium]
MVVEKDSPDTLHRTTSTLKKGGIVIAPGDTIYGVLGLAPSTADMIRKAKGRGEKKPFITLLPTREAAADYSVDELPRNIYDLWPGALTLIIRTEGDGTGAFRVPADEFLLAIMAVTGPLYSTSVNFSGGAPLWKIEDITDVFDARVDLIVSDGDLPGKMPSTVLDVTAKPFRILREGACHLPPEIISQCQ